MSTFSIRIRLKSVTHSHVSGRRGIGSKFTITSTVNGIPKTLDSLVPKDSTRNYDFEVYSATGIEGDVLTIPLQVTVIETTEDDVNDPGSNSQSWEIDLTNFFVEGEPYQPQQTDISVTVTEQTRQGLTESIRRNLGLTGVATITINYEALITRIESCLEIIFEATPGIYRNTPAAEQTVREAISLILSAARDQGVTGDQLAYMLATAIDESNLGTNVVEPESQGQNYEGNLFLGNINPGDGVRYRGRGYVQITGRLGYSYWTQRLQTEGYLTQDQNLVDTPDLATDPEIAAVILVVGIQENIFPRITPVSGYQDTLLADYIDARMSEGIAEDEARREAQGVATNTLAGGNSLADFIPDFPQPQVEGETGLTAEQRDQLRQGFVNARDIVNAGDSLINRREIANTAIAYAEAVRRSGCYRV